MTKNKEMSNPYKAPATLGKAKAMIFKYTLSSGWVEKVSKMVEFANGGTQVSVRLGDGRVFGGILISNATHPVAMRGFKDLPFSLDDVVEIFQAPEDQDPRHRGNWDFWDDWK